MPTITTAEVTAFAHCVRPRCPGYEQQEVPAIRTEDSWSYAEQGGDLPGQERSFVRYTFANEEDSVCPQCGGHRDLSDSPRKQYDGSLSGHDPMGLLDVEAFDPAKQHEVRDQQTQAENAALREEVAEMRGMMAAFMAQQGSPPAPEATPEAPAQED